MPVSPGTPGMSRFNRVSDALVGTEAGGGVHDRTGGQRGRSPAVPPATRTTVAVASRPSRATVYAAEVRPRTGAELPVGSSEAARVSNNQLRGRAAHRNETNPVF